MAEIYGRLSGRAVKMWMARLYPTFEPSICLTSNGLSAMSFALPGAIGAKLAEPGRRVLAAVGDGAFLMNSQEIETALRERIPLAVLIWQDDAYGLIKWKMDLELGHDVATGFSNPDFVANEYSVNRALLLLMRASWVTPHRSALFHPPISGV